jgi:hypothetical protein
MSCLGYLMLLRIQLTKQGTINPSWRPKIDSVVNVLGRAHEQQTVGRADI